MRPAWARAGPGGLRAASHPIDGCRFIETVRHVAQRLLQAVLEKSFTRLRVAAVVAEMADVAPEVAGAGGRPRALTAVPYGTKSSVVTRQ